MIRVAAGQNGVDVMVPLVSDNAKRTNLYQMMLRIADILEVRNAVEPSSLSLHSCVKLGYPQLVDMG